MTAIPFSIAYKSRAPVGVCVVTVFVPPKIIGWWHTTSSHPAALASVSVSIDASSATITRVTARSGWPHISPTLSQSIFIYAGAASNSAVQISCTFGIGFPHFRDLAERRLMIRQTLRPWVLCAAQSIDRRAERTFDA